MGVSYPFQFRDFFAAWHFLAKGLALTLFLSLATMVFGMAVGVAGAAARLYGGRLLRIVVGGYVEAIRNTPLLVQLRSEERRVRKECVSPCRARCSPHPSYKNSPPTPHSTTTIPYPPLPT